MTDDRGLNLEQVKRRIGCKNVMTVYRLIKAGKLIAFRTSKKAHLFVLESELEKRLKEWEVKPEVVEVVKEEAE